jgi:hypothetical protein
MGPRADFVCLSKKCFQDGAATVYELPVASTRCPVCSSKRIQRLYNSAPAVLRGVPDTFTATRRVIDHIVDDAGSAALAKADAGKQQRLAAQKANAPMFAVPLKQLGASLASFGIQAPNINMAGSRPSLAPAHPVAPMIRRGGPMPGPDSLGDNKRITSNGKVVEAGP